MSGTLSVPNTFASQSGNVPASQLDTDFSTISSYVNAREVTVGTIGTRPAAGTAGRWFLATDVNGGTVYVDTGAAWVQAALGVSQSASQSSARVRSSVNVSVSDSTVTTITYNTADWDDASFFNIGDPAKLTVPVTGKYLLVAEIDWDSSATSDGKTYEVLMLKNNVTVVADLVQYPGTNNAAPRMVLTTMANLTAADFVVVQAFQTSGGALNAQANNPKSPSFSIMRMS